MSENGYCRVEDATLDGVERELLEDLLCLIEDSGRRDCMLRFLIETATAFEAGGADDPAERVRRWVLEGEGGERKRRSQFWMLFQLAEELFDDPEDLRRLLYIESWAKKLGVGAEAQNVQANLLRGLALLARSRRK